MGRLEIQTIGFFIDLFILRLFFVNKVIILLNYILLSSNFILLTR